MCLRCSPGLFRHACGVAPCHTSSMAAKPHLGLTQNSSPTTLANERRAAQIAVSKGSASGRPAHGAKLPPAAAGEIPAGRSQRNTRAAHGAKSPIVQSAIRRWRNPHGVSRKAAVPTPSRVADGGLLCTPSVGRGILDAPAPHSFRGRQGCRPLRPRGLMVHPNGGTHRSRPTFHIGSPSRAVRDAVPTDQVCGHTFHCK